MRTSALRFFAVAALLAATAAACTAEAPQARSEDPPNLGAVSSPIINGVVDTTHPAVVAVISQSGQQQELCSGTIVKVDPSANIGWVLTAAHCVNFAPLFVAQADDYAKATVAYAIVDYAADPRYVQGGDPAQPYDVAVVRIAGVDASTPVIPMTGAPDGVLNGTAFTAVGYGRTTLIAATAPDTNTLRRSAALTVSQGTATAYGFVMTAKGICRGDSGGPDLVGGLGSERVIGVHSYVAGDCNGTGFSGRVTGNLTFINAELAKPLPTRTCDLCTAAVTHGVQPCALLTRACLDDPACAAFLDCVQKGGTGPACAGKNPTGEGPYNAAAECACAQACATECTGSYGCRGVPTCGFAYTANDCGKCTNASCCSETRECEKDGACFACLKTGDAAPACASNAARKRLAACTAASCAAQCAPPDGGPPVDPATAAGPGDDAGAPTGETTTTTTGCAASPAPAGGTGVPGLALASALTLAAHRRRRRA